MALTHYYNHEGELLAESVSVKVLRRNPGPLTPDQWVAQQFPGYAILQITTFTGMGKGDHIDLRLIPAEAFSN